MGGSIPLYGFKHIKILEVNKITIFKSKGSQRRHAYTLGDVVKKENKKIAYYNPETRIKKEGLTVLYDSHKTLVLFSEKTQTIYQFENN